MGHTLTMRVALTIAIAATAGAALTALSAILIGPHIFHQHLKQAGMGSDAALMAHIERGFLDATVIAILSGTAAALIFGVVGAWATTRRVRQALSTLTAAATQVSNRHHPRPIDPAGAGAEVADLVAAFNMMSSELATSEERRTQLLADLAHELRTPVANIRAWTESLNDGVVAWGPEAAQVFTTQSSRLTRLSGDLDDLSSADEHRLVRTLTWADLNDIARVTARTATRDAPDRIRLDLAEEPLLVKVDPERIGQILANLVSNSLRHTRADDTITLATHADDRNVQAIVSDSGDGIPTKDLAHVTDRFYRGDGARAVDPGGSGLGLTISAAIARAHGGTLIIHSEGPGHGTTATLALPAANDTSAPPQARLPQG